MANLLAGREYVDWALVPPAPPAVPVPVWVCRHYFYIEEDVCVDAVTKLSRKTQERRVEVVVARANIVSEETYISLSKVATYISSTSRDAEALAMSLMSAAMLSLKRLSVVKLRWFACVK